MSDAGRELPQRAISALVWIAAFCFASGIFLASTQLLRGLPPTPHIAVGRVTIENASKLRDYATEALFFLIAPVATVFLQRYGTRINDRLRRNAIGGRKDLVSLLFITPFFLAPFLYLTTSKWGWPLLIPLAASQALPWTAITVQRTWWLRRLPRRDLAPYHAMILANGFAWILFRYIATARRIAHVPTLFLEIVFVLFFMLLFWAVFIFMARLASLLNGVDFEIALKRLAIAGLPLVILPFLALALLPPAAAISVVMIAVLVAIAFALRGGEVEPPERVRAIVAYAVIPLLLYALSYASMANAAQFLDLFHRGESLGPASDYLRGKAPYRDVFVLHGLMHDGQLDAWLFQLFGRRLEVAMARPVILAAFASPALWYVGMTIFQSIPLAVATMLLGSVTTQDNERTLFEIATLAFVIAGVRGRVRPLLLFFGGLSAALALFFSYDIGLYSVGGGILFLAFAGRWKGLASFIAGLVFGAGPFLIYLGSRGSLPAFFDTTFVMVPRIIDPIWSIPFPDVAATFRANLSLRTLADFLITDNFRFILNPLVIAIAMTCLVYRAIRKRTDWLDMGLLALTAFALLTQRSALGRSDPAHEYFSAFLIGPMILALLVMLAREAAPLWRSRDANGPAFLLLACVAAAPLFITALWVPDVLNFRLDDLVRYQPRVVGAIHDPLADEVKNRIDSVRYHVFDLSRKGSPIFDFSNQPAFYFFLDRPNPTRFYQVPILSPAQFQRETIEALERAKPQVVIRRSPQGFDLFDGVDNSIRAQAVAAYLDDRYAYARSVRGVELWTRKPVTATAPVDRYLRLIRIPTAKELAATGARSRLIFPSVGSTPGANDSFWRSDLTLRNPYKEAIDLGLRYVAGDTRLDRRVMLAGGQTMRWEDVVRNLFHGPDSLGVLWIDYRGERGPVARVQTFDVTRRSSGSIEGPLSSRDAATAGSDTNVLTIIGFPGGAPTERRINVGVVNVGDIPASFRITVRTRAGGAIGKPIEEGLPEDESMHVTDIEHAVGVSIDENNVIEVSMIAGTCVAYATVVGNDGSNQFIAALPSPKL
ncbi:MAG TPA: hypothetical protein VLV78_19030 [Thermoanaerobaculia bacterium]|nr:hypothetical protein [Thermoanaerobaculia bacterium]